MSSDNMSNMSLSHQNDLKVNLSFWISSNTVLLIMSSFYVLFYARVFEKFGLFVRICKLSLMGMGNFIIFLVFWMQLFMYLNLFASGQEASDDYKNLDFWSSSIINTFRNTIGDL